MKISKKERRLTDFAGLYSARYGVSMDLTYTTLSPRERLQNSIIKGIIIFLCVYGSLGLFISSLSLPCIKFAVFAATLIASMALALLYYNQLTFNLGYILVFVVVCGLSYLLYWYANSGINAILNLLLGVIDDKLNLKGVREYTEFVTNRRLTITCCLILIAILEACFFNSAVSGYMSPFLTFLLLYPIVQICVYLDDEINYFYFFMIALGFFGVFIIRKSGRFATPVKGNAPNVVMKGNVIYRKASRFTLTMKHMFATAGIFLLSMMLIGALFVNMTPRYMRSNISSWKDGTDSVVKQFAMSGLLAFFNQYASTGGMSNGRLGGIREVGFDMQTDLVIEHVPDNYDGIYLRAFVGDVYENNQWNPLSDKSVRSLRMTFPDSLMLVNKETDLLKYLYENGNEKSSLAKMTIRNVGADRGFYYLPYYTDVDLNTLNPAGSSSVLVWADYLRVARNFYNFGNEITLWYYPSQSVFEDALKNENPLSVVENYNNPVEEAYREFVYDNYLYIPQSIRGDLEEICDRYIPGEDLETIMSQLYDYFANNFLYTQRPGITPNKRDFVVYFLKEQKKGFCAHFATAAAMLLRAKGIPARYVEGYNLSYSDATVMEEVESENVADWYQGYNATVEEGEEASVLKVEISDIYAHAWVEIYYDGFGWVPAEFTIADIDPSDEEGSFWSRFGGLFNNDDDGDGTSPIGNLTKQLRGLMPVLIAILIFGGLISLIVFYSLRLLRMYRLYFDRKNERLTRQYLIVTKLLKECGIAKERNVYHHIALRYFVRTLGIQEEEAANYISLVEKASYSDSELTVDELETATECFKHFINNLSEISGAGRKLKLRLRY